MTTKQEENFYPLNKTEMQWLSNHRFDLYYSLNVEEMYETDQAIFRSISEKLEKSAKSWKFLTPQGATTPLKKILGMFVPSILGIKRYILLSPPPLLIN